MSEKKLDLEEQRTIFDLNLNGFEKEVTTDGLQEAIVSFLVYSSYYSHSKEKSKEERTKIFSEAEVKALGKIESLLLGITYDGFSLESEDHELFVKYRENFQRCNLPL
ncbi:MAG: hypothetical protein ACRBFS_17890 [Aureispira sp.]